MPGPIPRYALLVAGVLSACAAWAQEPAFVRATGLNDPFPPHPTAVREWYGNAMTGPLFVDLDADGDRELISTERRHDLWVSAVSYLHVHSADGYEAPFWLGQWDEYPIVEDLDGDGDLDAIGRFAFGDDGRYWEQTAPYVWTPRTGAANPFSGFAIPRWLNSVVPVAGDVDDDGDRDVIAVSSSTLLFARRDGPAAYTLNPVPNPLSGILGGTTSFPTLIDMDADGDDDLVVSSPGAQPRYYEHVQPGMFAERPHPVNDLPTGDRLVMADVDADGDVDAVITEGTRYLHYEWDEGEFVLRDGLYDVLGGFVNAEEVIGLEVVDADGDLDADLLLATIPFGDNAVRFRMLQQVPGDGARRWHDGGTSPFENLVIPRDPFETGERLAIADLDEDGDLDVVVGAITGQFRLLEQTAPGVFKERAGGDSPFQNIDTGYWSSPAIADVDGDGDLDIVSTGNPILEYWSPQPLHFIEQTAPMTFALRTGAGSPLDSLDLRYCEPGVTHPTSSQRRGFPSFADYDADGDPDLLVDRCLFRNTDGRFQTVFSGNPLADLPSAFRRAVALLDADQDGDLDAVTIETGFAAAQDRVLATYLGTGIGTTPNERPPDAAGGLTLGEPAPNPAATAVRLTLTVGRSQDVAVHLYDALGRRLAVLHDGPVTAGLPLGLQANVAGLPAGAYVVRATGEDGAASRRLSLAR